MFFLLMISLPTEMPNAAKLVGMGFIIEKAFQNGRKILEEKGVRVESLAIIEDLSNCCIKIKDQ